jgi:malate permease and related proteins
VVVPQPLLASTTLVGGATVPVMLMLLGLQLSQAQVGRRYKEVSVGVGLRLVVGALLAVVVAPLMGLQGLARSVAITEAATPTAVNSALMAVQFDADADYVTSVIFFSTLLSSVTLTLLLSFLV